MSLGTREACEILGVSQTTLKRWISYFPNVFPKDQLGHYLFAERELKLLEKIKEEVRGGVPMDKIELPVAQERDAAAAAGAAAFSGTEADTLRLRVAQLERALAQKADEVVAAQIYQHRQEIDELRLMLRQLSEAVEGLQQAAAAREPEAARPEPARKPEPAAGGARTTGAAAVRAARRKVFWLF